MHNRGMSESAIPSWFLEAMIFLALAQTVLLVVACLLLRDWGSKLNRKLHRIESNTRHTSQAVGYKEEEELDEVR
jgi:hypothetical protein